MGRKKGLLGAQTARPSLTVVGGAERSKMLENKVDFFMTVRGMGVFILMYSV